MDVHTVHRVRKLPEEIGFFREEWKKLEKSYFFQFLPEESGKNWNKVEETGRNNYMKPNKDTNKLVEISFKILECQCKSVFHKFREFCKVPVLGPVLSSTFHYFMYSRPKHAQMPTP